MDKPQLDEPTIHDELAAYLEQHAEFYPNARAKLTAEGLAELEKLEKHWLQQWKERRGDVLTFVPHFSCGTTFTAPSGRTWLAVILDGSAFGAIGGS